MYVHCPKIAEDMRQIMAVFAPPPDIDLAQWAEIHARTKDGNHYRPWPYQVGLLNEMTNRSTEEVTLMKSARTGYSQILVIYIAHRMVNDPGQLLMYLPTVEKAEEFSTEYIEPMMQWPVMVKLQDLKKLFGLRDDKILVKRFPGGQLKMLGANSTNAFRGHDGDWVGIDEADGMPIEVGKGGKEGDTFTLILKRLEQSHDPKAFNGSTPTDELTSAIYARFLMSDQRFYNVKCGACGKLQKLIWGEAGKTGIQWAPKKNPTEVWYQCESGCRIEEKDKWKIQEDGGWIAENPDAYRTRKHAGFHISTLYSFQPNATWIKLVYEFLSAQGRLSKLKSFFNTTLGEVWKFRGDTPNWVRLRDRREDRPLGIVPYGACFLTAGIDVQAANGGRIEIHVWGWGSTGESWIVDRIEIAGSPTDDRTWQQVHEVIRRKWRHQSGNMMPLHRVAVDCSYATLHAWRFCMNAGANWCLPVRGMSKGNAMIAPMISESVPMDLVLDKGVKKNAVRVHIVGSHVLKQELYGCLNLEAPGEGERHPAGYVHLSTGLGESWVKQLVAEDFNPDTGEWIKRGANEALDCWVYARAAAVHAGVERWSDEDWIRLEAEWGDPEKLKLPEPEAPKITQRSEDPVVIEHQPQPLTEQSVTQQPKRRKQRGESWLYGGR